MRTDYAVFRVGDSQIVEENMTLTSAARAALLRHEETGGAYRVLDRGKAIEDFDAEGFDSETASEMYRIGAFRSVTRREVAEVCRKARKEYGDPVRFADDCVLYGYWIRRTLARTYRISPRNVWGTSTDYRTVGEVWNALRPMMRNDND